jgi:hypothetical protein
MLIPSVDGVLAAILFLIQGGFGAGHGPFHPIIGFLGLPSMLWFPASERLPLPSAVEHHDFLLVIGGPTVMNLGLFALAGFVSWIWFPFRRIDLLPKESSDQLDRTGGSMEDALSSVSWEASGAKDQNIIRAEDVHGVQTLSRACEQAPGMDTRAKKERLTGKNLLFGVMTIILGHLMEALFCFLLFNTRHILLWRTLFVLAGFSSGVLLIFMGCVRLSQGTRQGVSAKHAPRQERPSVS